MILRVCMIQAYYNAITTRKYIEIVSSSNIDYYNSILALEAEHLVFSADGNFEVLGLIKRRDPDIFNTPHRQTKWGGKTYYPTDQ